MFFFSNIYNREKKDRMINYINQLNELLDDYLNNRENYRIDTELLEPLEPNPRDHEQLESVVTNFTSNQYVGKYETNERLLFFVYRIFRELIQRYRRRMRLPSQSIVFIYKGAILLRVIFKQYSNNLHPNVRNFIDKHYNNLFGISDLDFGIVLDETLENYEVVYEDMMYLSFYALRIIRDALRTEIDLLDYNNFNDQYKQKLLLDLRAKMNNLTANLRYICKLSHNNISNNQPCVINYSLENESQLQDLVINDTRVYAPVNIGPNVNPISGDFICSINKNIEYAVPGKNIRFALSRIKIPFSYYYSIRGSRDNADNNLGYVKGELIDIGITHRETSRIETESPHFTTYEIRNKKIMGYTLEYSIFELMHMVFLSNNTNGSITAQPKFEKRMKRLFAFLILQTLLTTNRVENIRNELIRYRNNETPIDFRNEILNMFFSELHVVSNEDETPREIRTMIYHQIKIFIKTLFLHMNENIHVPQANLSYREKYNLMRTTYHDIRSKYIKFESKTKFHDILIHLIEIFITTSNIGDTNVVKFTRSFDYLINIFRTNTPVDQIYKDYDSRTDQTYMTLRNGERKILYNYDEQFFAFMIISYLSEYFCFKTLYTNNQYNTHAMPRRNNYQMEYFGTNPRDTNRQIYRENVTGDIVSLLGNLFEELELVYRKAITKLIMTIATRFVETFDNIKNLMICVSDERINKYTRENEYDFIYHFWKRRICDYYADDHPDSMQIINECVIETLEFFSEQNGAMYATMAFGFFSWLHLEPQNVENRSMRFSNCISSSILEIYLLMRLFEHPRFVKQNIEIPERGYVHEFYPNTQRLLRRGVSHWGTSLLYQTAPGMRRNNHQFRNAYPNVYWYDILDKKNLFISLIFPGIDINKILARTHNRHVVQTFDNLMNALLAQFP
jgi:hypothetical protein